MRVGQVNQQGVLCLQIPISQRRREHRDLSTLHRTYEEFVETVKIYRKGCLPIKKKVEQDSFVDVYRKHYLPTKEKTDQDTVPTKGNGKVKIEKPLHLFISKDCIDDKEEPASELAKFWMKHFENRACSEPLLAIQLVGFLEQCIEHGLHQALTSIMWRIRRFECLQHADTETMSNLIATQIKSFPYHREGSLKELDFIKKMVGSPDDTKLLSLFERTVRKLESNDLVMCLWLFILLKIPVTMNKTIWRRLAGLDHSPHADLLGVYRRRWSKERSISRLHTELHFLMGRPDALFFAPIRAVLRLDTRINQLTPLRAVLRRDTGSKRLLDKELSCRYKYIRENVEIELYRRWNESKNYMET